jgi:hypothetical protein
VEAGRMGNIKYKDEMDLIYMLILVQCRLVVQTHIDDGIESLEQITEAIENGTENIKVQNMKN